MFTLQFSTDNAAFEDCDSAPTGEIVRILRQVADDVEKYWETSGEIRDANGNSVGSFDLK